MRTLLLFFLLAPALLPAQEKYFDEFWPSVGFSYSRGMPYLDVGVRWYHLYPDQDDIETTFSGASLGCELGFPRTWPVNIVYMGWQGHLLGIGYGIRAEYASVYNGRSFGCMGELGVSVLETLRITGGYRVSFNYDDPMQLNGPRISVVAAIPVQQLLFGKKRYNFLFDAGAGKTGDAPAQ